jgi:hypothetical protein
MSLISECNNYILIHGILCRKCIYYVMKDNIQNETLYSQLTCKIPLPREGTDKDLRTKTHMLNESKLMNNY